MTHTDIPRSTNPIDLVGIDDLLSQEEKPVRAAVRQVCSSS
jgi:hypothetical protein